MTGIVANPVTAWTTGQHVVMGDGNPVTWSGAAWTGGIAPLATAKRGPGRPRKITDAEA